MANPFDNIKKTITHGGASYTYYDFNSLPSSDIKTLPYSIRILLESAVRNCDNFSVEQTDVHKIVAWNENAGKVEIPFKPARVLLQDLTGVPAVVDLAALRDAMHRLGGDPLKINPLVPVDLVIDHSIQVDVNGSAQSLEKNQELEYQRNSERFQFLKWGSKAFENLLIVPPGSGICHQVNLEYLARVVFQEKNGVLYPDSVVGTDSHTTMINGLGVCGWGVGGIEAEAVMLGQPMSMVLPEVLGYKLYGKLSPQATSTDLVLTITQNLRAKGVVGKFVEFFGDGVAQLSLADRATISNMAPEYGATMGFFPVDDVTIDYLKQTGRANEKIEIIKEYMKASKLYCNYNEPTTIQFTSVIELDLSSVVPCLSGPKRPQDRVALTAMKSEFASALTAKVGFKGYGLKPEVVDRRGKFEYEGKTYDIGHGAVILAAITSCTNTSNPSVILGAGLLAKKAVEAGLSVKPFCKTSLSPGSGVVTKYLNESGLQKYLDQLGFNVTGYGCMTCIGNSGDINKSVEDVIVKEDLVVAGVLSGNRNFEGRIHPNLRANYLASPPLVVAYALAGSVLLDFDVDPIGVSSTTGKNVYLRDIWPSRAEVQDAINKFVLPEMFQKVYADIKTGNERWNALKVPDATLYPWDSSSTYIHHPPFFQSMTMTPPGAKTVNNAYCLLNLGDSITTDHISPAGSISRKSPAARFLESRGVKPEDFNTYGARRGNDEIMSRGTFANSRIVNKLAGKVGPQTLHVPSNEILDIYDAAEKYQQNGSDLIVLAGVEYGSGSSRDWAAKGPKLQGISAAIAVSFERIHRSNLVGMGIIPLQFKEGESADSLGLTGKEQFSISLPSDIQTGQDIIVKTDTGKTFTTKLRFDTPIEIEYHRHGGILPFVLRKLVKGAN